MQSTVKPNATPKAPQHQIHAHTHTSQSRCIYSIYCTRMYRKIKLLCRSYYPTL
ncbi:hypothetical protein BDQ12DRAFT_383196 [Crucibulum laeve]|uniref:Uncharacterized protein n=1 Tax=Crucibulum laeve TaxID=68775 RepID=A0A5C3LLS7_9AGAR|nr:hypothetical protein BDQ12DRAFT_383196 [Crucibulum laeve]